jgi:hypothetical protein
MAASFCSVAPQPSRPDGWGCRCSDRGTRSNPGLSTNTVSVFATHNVLRIRRCSHEGSEHHFDAAQGSRKAKATSRGMV